VPKKVLVSKRVAAKIGLIVDRRILLFEIVLFKVCSFCVRKDFRTLFERPNE